MTKVLGIARCFVAFVGCRHGALLIVLIAPGCEKFLLTFAKLKYRLCYTPAIYVPTAHKAGIAA